MNYKYNIINIENIYTGFHKLNKYTYNHTKFNGSVSNTITRELLDRKNAVGVIPYDPKEDKIILIEQIRTGVLSNHEHPWLYETIAGVIDSEHNSKNNPEHNKEFTAKKECLEEAGCTVSKLIPIYEYYMTPGCSSEKMTLYCGITDISNIQNHSLHGLPEENEDIKVHVFSLNEALQMLEDNIIRNATTIIALQWLKINAKNLK